MWSNLLALCLSGVQCGFLVYTTYTKWTPVGYSWSVKMRTLYCSSTFIKSTSWITEEFEDPHWWMLLVDAAGFINNFTQCPGLHSLKSSHCHQTGVFIGGFHTGWHHRGPRSMREDWSMFTGLTRKHHARPAKLSNSITCSDQHSMTLADWLHCIKGNLISDSTFWKEQFLERVVVSVMTFSPISRHTIEQI